MTDTGFLLAKDMLRCVEVICDRLPAVGFDLTTEETAALACAIVLSLPEHCRERLARHGGGRKTKIMK